MTGPLETSPRFLARMAGLFFLLTIIAGSFAQGFVSERLIVWSDGGATAANTQAHHQLFVLGFTVYLIEMACQVAMKTQPLILPNLQVGVPALAFEMPTILMVCLHSPFQTIAVQCFPN